jgi:hypothetical protein
VPDFSDDGAGIEASLSALETRWEIAPGSSLQAGKLLELPRSSVITGRSSFEGAEVRVAASPQSVLPFQQALGAVPFVPRGRNALVHSERFAVSVDPGRLDLSVRAPETLGFAWFVKPGIEIANEDRDLGPVALEVPSVLRGTTTGLFDDRDQVTREPVVLTKPVGACSVRAYAYLDEDSAYTRDAASAVSVIQVAETRSDESGAFRLLVPSKLAK